MRNCRRRCIWRFGRDKKAVSCCSFLVRPRGPLRTRHHQDDSPGEKPGTRNQKRKTRNESVPEVAMDFVEQLKSSVDIVKTIQGYGVKLKRTGSTGRYLGLCPFHTEKTPSFNVNATMQRYKCFGCNVGGD